MAKIVDANILNACCFSNATPGLLEIGKVLPGLSAVDDIGIVVQAGD